MPTKTHTKSERTPPRTKEAYSLPSPAEIGISMRFYNQIIRLLSRQTQDPALIRPSSSVRAYFLMVKNAVLRAGMHIVLVVSLPLVLVSFAITTAPAHSVKPVPADTYAISIAGNTPAEAGLQPVVLGTGTLVLSSDHTYTLSITGHHDYLGSFTDKGAYSIQDNGISMRSTIRHPANRISYQQVTLGTAGIADNTVRSVASTVLVVNKKASYAGILYGYVKK